MEQDGDGRTLDLGVVVAGLDPAGRSIENHFWH